MMLIDRSWQVLRFMCSMQRWSFSPEAYEVYFGAYVKVFWNNNAGRGDAT